MFEIEFKFSKISSMRSKPLDVKSLQTNRMADLLDHNIRFVSLTK